MRDGVGRPKVVVWPNEAVLEGRTRDGPNG